MTRSENQKNTADRIQVGAPVVIPFDHRVLGIVLTVGTRPCHPHQTFVEVDWNSGSRTWHRVFETNALRVMVFAIAATPETVASIVARRV